MKFFKIFLLSSIFIKVPLCNAGILSDFKKELSSKKTQDESCVADAVIHEAGAEIYDGQVAVAQVIKNRSLVSGESPCSITHEKHNGIYQFSYMSHRTPVKDEGQLITAKEIAHKVLASDVDDVTNGSQFFKRCTKPGHNYSSFKYVKKIGNQCYYKDMEPSDKYADALLVATNMTTGVPGYRFIDYSPNYTTVARVWSAREEHNRRRRHILVPENASIASLNIKNSATEKLNELSKAGLINKSKIIANENYIDNSPENKISLFKQR